MLASIIIPVFNDSNGLRVTLESIKLHLETRKDIEIIVCNDGGGEDISKVTSSYGVREVRLDRNNGSYAARNRGIEASHGSILVFLDADQRITESWLDAGLASLRDADYAGGRIMIMTTDNPCIWEQVDAKVAFPVKNYLDNYHFAPTANLFVRKDIFYKVGLFNEILRSGGDKEFGERVFNNGFKQIYAPNAITLHPARNKIEQLIKLKRTAIGNAELALLIYKENPFLFLFWIIKNLIQMFMEITWRLLRYPFFDYWKKGQNNLGFILTKKLRKIIYLGNLMIHAVKIYANSKQRKISKTS